VTEDEVVVFRGRSELDEVLDGEYRGLGIPVDSNGLGCGKGPPSSPAVEWIPPRRYN